MTVPDILARIVEAKRREVAAGRAACPDPVPRADRRPFAAALQGPGVRLVAEVKRQSPSRGVIRADFDPADLARQYQEAGTAAISVLTDREFFGGELAYLDQVREAVSLPLLRKDFLIDPWQLRESAAAGADAVLLIARLLEGRELADLLALAAELRLECLVEVHDERDLERALAAGARLVGINNRDLATFQVDLGVTRRLRPLVPPEVTVIAESGIHQPSDVRLLRELRVHAMLVGEALMAARHPGRAARDLIAAGEGEA